MKFPNLAPSVILGATLVVSSASAATTTIGVVGDAHIRSGSGQANTSSGAGNLVLVGDTEAGNDYIRGLFSFDLSAPELAGATINGVTLRLTIGSKDVDPDLVSSTEVLQLFQLSQAFVESSVTWNQASAGTSWTPGGAYDNTTILSSISANPATVGANETFTFTTSSAFASSVASTAQQTNKTLSLIVKLETENNGRSIFRFNAGSGNPLQAVEYRPQLTIDYTPAAIPEPATFAALVAAGMLGFAACRRRARP